MPSKLFIACISPAVFLATFPGCFAETLPAFPEAVGQGAAATGGRGGDVYHVTNLRDYNSDTDEPKIEGSLRHAIRSAEGPRTIVFDVSGPIALACPLEILKSDLTIAGQTSPAGITLWGYPLEISKCSDVIVRYLRVRLGDFHAERDAQGSSEGYTNGNNDLKASSANAISIHGGAERVLLDHLSVCWGMDETLSVTKCRDVTVQNCFITESLRRSYHSKGAHGYGSLVRGELTPEDQDKNVGGFTFYRNLWAHHDARNPSIAGQQRLDAGQAEKDRRRTDVNLANCVIYNWGNEPTHRSNKGEVRIHLLANYYANGPAEDTQYIFRGTSSGATYLRHAGNIHDRNVDDQLNGQVIDSPEEIADAFYKMNDDDTVEPADPPFGFIGRLEQYLLPATEACRYVVESGGASLWRDAIDSRVARSVQTGQGKIIDSQEELRTARGLPGIDDLKKSRRPTGFDVDRDGMADTFERQNGLSPDDPSDGNKTTLSERGYTNLEVYLQSLVEGQSGDDATGGNQQEGS